MWDWKRYKQQVDLEKTRLVHGGVLDEVGDCESGGTGVIDGCGCLLLLPRRWDEGNHSDSGRRKRGAAWVEVGVEGSFLFWGKVVREGAPGNPSPKPVIWLEVIGRNSRRNLNEEERKG